MLLAGALSFFFLDLQKRRILITRKSVPISTTVELNRRKQKLRQRKRQYKNRKFKNRQFFKAKVLKLKGTHSKDNRISNQRKLRRMYRNC